MDDLNDFSRLINNDTNKFYSQSCKILIHVNFGFYFFYLVKINKLIFLIYDESIKTIKVIHLNGRSLRH